MLSQVRFIGDEQARDIVGQIDSRRSVRLMRLDDVEQKLRVGQEGAGTTVALDFDGVGRVALAGGMVLPWVAGRLGGAAGLRFVFGMIAASFAAILVLSRVAAHFDRKGSWGAVQNNYRSAAPR